MNNAKRRTVIAGNWKMNFTPAEAKAFIEEIKPMVAGKDACDIIFCAPYVDIAPAMEAAAGSNIKIGAENVHFEEKGAYTGEVSAKMLTSMGVEYVIIGHSERRQYFGETDETVNKRTKAALAAGMKVILCLGEVKDERLNGITNEVVAMQTKLDLKDVTAEELKNVIIAYEPVWAIGTGLTATPEQADETCGVIRSVVAELYGADAA
ncbi:MAG: triose-phosphate isomerase, partial [Clostridia bacterium]|nr:triose-phosphate isomerase [Clostridia bacterium]